MLINLNKHKPQNNDITTQSAAQVITSSDEHLSRLLSHWQVPTIEDTPQHTLHFWSSSRFALHDVMCRMLRIIGPAHVIMSTYSFSQAAANIISRFADEHYLLSMKLLINANRAASLQARKSISQLPQGIDIRYAAIHAKAIVLWNDKYTISIVYTANASNSDTIERGFIATDFNTFNFDRNELNRIHTQSARVR